MPMLRIDWDGYICSRTSFERVTKMKKEIPLTKHSLIALHVVLALLGAVVAAFTYYRYNALARGILGVAFLYLILNRNAFESLYGPIETQLLRPKKPRAFVTAFLAAAICTWAVMQTVEAVMFYLGT
jgi:hypothetical protein